MVRSDPIWESVNNVNQSGLSERGKEIGFNAQEKCI